MEKKECFAVQKAMNDITIGIVKDLKKMSA